MTKSNINFRIYQAATDLKSRILKKVPISQISKQYDLSKKLQIGITTYIDRYDQFFKPLYLNLSLLFPEIDIYVAVNGFFDQTLQHRYLEQLCPVGLTRLWNEILSQGKSSTTLLLNDDLMIYPWFRVWIENNYTRANNITLINGTWSHFFFNKSLLSNVGIFDEKFKGIGFEDMDYTIRCGIKGIEINNLKCNYIEHKDHQPTRTSFDQYSDTLWGPKYSSVNHEYFFWKWKQSEDNTGVFVKQLNYSMQENNSVEDQYQTADIVFTNNLSYPDRD
jgi:hypothetical protein